MERYSPHIAAALIGLFAVVGLISGHGVTTGTESPAERAADSWTNRFGGAILLLILVCLYAFYITQNRRTTAFISQLSGVHEQLLDGRSVSVGGIEINRNTEVTQFQSCVSFIFPFPWGMKVDSAPLLHGQSGRLRIALLCSLITVLFGWMGVWTVIWLFSTLVVNLRGGRRQTVAEFLSSSYSGPEVDSPHDSPHNQALNRTETRLAN